jgi:protein-arginine kinase activator protein McsA
MLNYCPQCGLNLSEFYGWFRCWRCHRWFDQSLVEINPDRRSQSLNGTVEQHEPWSDSARADIISAPRLL